MNKSEAGKLGAIASAETISKLKQDRINSYYVTPKQCKNCDEVIAYEYRVNAFCSSSCSATFNNLRKSKKDHGTCDECHTPLTCKKHPKNNNNFCDRNCQSAFNNKLNFELFQKGELASVASKAQMIKLHGFKCMDCGWDKVNPLSNKCPVELEHIDGNSQNNLPDNLKLLCPNCHSLTPTYKALNVGKGRYSRMKRYNEGKSS